MPSRKFSLVAGGTKNIEMSWSGNWKNVSIQMDGREIGTIPDKQTLNMGQQFALPDGSRLAVRLKQSAFSPALEVTRDGRPLPGSDSDPEQQIKTAAQIIWLIAGFNIILGVITLVAKIDFLQQIVDPTAIIFGWCSPFWATSFRSVRWPRWHWPSACLSSPRF